MNDICVIWLCLLLLTQVTVIHLVVQSIINSIISQGFIMSSGRHKSKKAYIFKKSVELFLKLFWPKNCSVCM